jgi:hypothetical protein
MLWIVIFGVVMPCSLAGCCRRSYETSARRHKPEDHDRYLQRCENLKSLMNRAYFLLISIGPVLTGNNNAIKNEERQVSEMYVLN